MPQPTRDRKSDAAERQSIRLFVALDIPEEVRRSVGELAAQFKKLCPSAKWVNLEGAHVTLKFISWVAVDRLEKIQQALAAAAAPPAAAPIFAFDLHFAGLGFFPSSRRPRVFWVGIEGGPELQRLAANIEVALLPLGIPQETREFHPHLTLARFQQHPGPGGAPRRFAAGGKATLDATDAMRRPEIAALTVAVDSHAADDFGAARIEQFHLYQSVLKSSGAEYTRLSSYLLPG